MQPENNGNDTGVPRDGQQEQPTTQDILNRIKDSREGVAAAREEALDDIAQDADLSISSPNDDLDEGETAQLGEDRTDLV